MKKYINFTKDELLKLVEKQDVELTTKKYGLVWDSEKEPEQVVLDCEKNIPIIKRIKEKVIRTDDSNDNIIIEGDNFHALTCLNYTHKGKIDVIYIDPPYNTGKAKEWKYNDRYVDENDGYRHSKWLNFMEKRLRLASNLLKDDGVIFISINNYEASQLKLLADKILGENCFVEQLTIVSSANGMGGKEGFANNHEYCLCYKKSPEKNFRFKGLAQTSAYKEKYNKTDKGGKYKMDGLLRKKGEGARRKDSPGCYYPLYYNKISHEVVLDQNANFIEVYPKLPNGNDGRWVWSKDFAKDRLHRLYASEKGTIYVKDYYHEDLREKPKSVFNKSQYLTNIATNEIKEIFNGEKKFDTVKPIGFIVDLLDCTTSDNSIILDFFAGSGTTGHAVLELNKRDNGKRKFVLCTNNEGNICEQVTYPRLQKIIKGYKFKGKDKTMLYEKKITLAQLKNIDEIMVEINKITADNKSRYDEIKKEFSNNIIKLYGVKNIQCRKDGTNGNLQYYKTDLIPVDRIDSINDKQRHELTEKAGQMIAIKENTFEEIETNEWYQIFANKDNNRKTAIYFRENVDKFENLVKKLDGTQTVLYVFSYGRIDKKLFKYLDRNILIEDIPEPVLEIYKEINLTIKDN
jgi:adenine-specific DNA-methyltransferase